MNPETIQQIRGGDLDAYETVVRQYQGILLGYAVHRLPDINTAQDVVQLTFIRAYEQLDEYQSERDFGVWLCVICKHFIMTELERSRRESKNLEKYSHSLRLRVVQEMASPRESGASENLTALRLCLKKLQAKSAELVRLRYEERQSCQQIADAMQRSLTWVTSTLSRSRTALKLCLDGRPSEEATS